MEGIFKYQTRVVAFFYDKDENKDEIRELRLSSQAQG